MLSQASQTGTVLCYTQGRRNKTKGRSPSVSRLNLSGSTRVTNFFPAPQPLLSNSLPPVNIEVNGNVAVMVAGFSQESKGQTR